MAGIKSFLFMSFLILFTLVLGCLCLPLLLLPRSWNVGVVHWWCGVVLGAHAKIIGVKTIIKGEEHIPEGPFILAPKHQAMWETIKVIRLVHDPAIVLKKELMYIPIFGWWAAKMKMISIDRATKASALRKMMNEAKAAAEAGRPIVIFPEGTRAPVGGMNPYKPGVAALYKALGYPVVPAALNSGKCWPRKGYDFKPGTITFEYLEPIPAGLDKRVFLEQLETRIEGATRALEAQ